MDMNGHGGARKGAGRKKAEIKTGSSASEEIKTGVSTEIKKGVHVVLKENCSTVPVPSEQEGGVSAAAASLVEEPLAKVIPLPVSADFTTHAEHAFSQFDPRLDSPEVPEFPGMDLLEPAVVPSPPKLNSDDPDGSWCMALVRAYRGAVQSRYKVRSGAFRQNNIATSKYAKGLVEAAKKLLEHDIPPAAWAAFSLDVWRKYGEGKGSEKPPALQWVFAAKRIEERRGWYKAESSSYTGGRVLFGKSAKELFERYQQMRVGLLCTELPVAQVVAQHFPDGLYDRLLRRAREEAQAERTRLKAALAQGEWLWR